MAGHDDLRKKTQSSNKGYNHKQNEANKCFMEITASSSATLLLVTIASFMMFLPHQSSKILLNSGEFFSSGIYVLTMQKDCNLVVTHNEPLRIPVWASNTSKQGENCVLVLEETCELRIIRLKIRWPVEAFLVWSNLLVINEQSRLPCGLYLDDNYLFLADAQGKSAWKQSMNQY